MKGPMGERRSFKSNRSISSGSKIFKSRKDHEQVNKSCRSESLQSKKTHDKRGSKSFPSKRNPHPPSEATPVVMEPFYLKSCILYLDSAVVDVSSEAEMNGLHRGCDEEFSRFNTVLKVSGNSQNIGIDFDQFSNIMFISAYDLTTCANANEPGLIPSVMAGALTLKVKFSASPSTNITIIGIAEYAECLKVLYLLIAYLNVYLKANSHIATSRTQTIKTTAEGNCKSN